MKILYISQYFVPEMGAPAARVHELAARWARLGHQVTVLTGFPNHPTGVVPREYRGKRRRLIWRERVDGINVVRVWLMPLPNRKPWQRILNCASFWLSSSLFGAFLKRPDVVIATSPQLLVGLAGWWLSKVKRAPFVFEVRDLWPESLLAVSVSGVRSGLYRFLRALSRFLYRRCDRVVVVTPAFKDHLIARWGVEEGKISVVENGVETALFSPGEGGVARREFGLEGRFVVSYIGTIGMAHGLGTILQAAGQLRSDGSKVVFLLVGEGAEKQTLRNEAAARGLNNVRFVDQKPRAFMPACIRASDACLVLLRKQEIFKTVIPTKLLECMACGRPVILGVEGQAREIVERARAGLSVEPENPEALAAAIRTLESNTALRQKLGENGRRWVVEHLSRARLAAKYLGVLKAMTAQHTPVELRSLFPERGSSQDLGMA
jgi:glycosyltransferase involved in cell wall biosynthesis